MAGFAVRVGAVPIFAIGLSLALSSCAGGGSGSSDPQALGSVSLSWDAPTTDENGDPLVDLIGYNVYMGSTPGTYTDVFELDDDTAVEISDLIPGTYYFVVTAIDASGNESTQSNEVSAVVQ